MHQRTHESVADRIEKRTAAGDTLSLLGTIWQEKSYSDWLSMTQGDNANMHPQATASVCGEGGSNIRAGEIVGGENPSIPPFDGIDEGIDEGTDVPYGASVNFDRRQ